MKKLFGADRGQLWRGPVAFVVATSFALSSLGCAHLPKTGAEATGEPLNVEVKTETHTYVTQAKVGEVVSRDSSGRVIGTSEVYENRTGQYDVTRWTAFQGDTQLDDQDFYRIAGDEKTAREIADYRQSGVSLNKAGAITLIIGGALAVGGIILNATGAMNSTKTDSSGYTTTETSAVPTYMMTFGLVGGSVGGVLMFYGAAKAKREHPIDDPARADKAARRYNKTLGAAATSEEEEPPPPPKPKKKKKKKKHHDEDEDED